MDIAAEAGHGRARESVGAGLLDHQSHARQELSRSRLESEQNGHRGAGLGLEQVDERIGALHRIHDGSHDVASRRRVESVLHRYWLVSRQERSVTAQGVVIHHVEHIVAITVLDQHVADHIGLAVVYEVKLMVALDSDELHEPFSHLWKGELDIVVTEGDRETVSALEQIAQGREQHAVTLYDGLQLACRRLRIQGERLPALRCRLFLGEKVYEVAVDYELDGRRSGLLFRECGYESRERGHLSADSEAAVVRIIGLRVFATDMQIGNDEYLACRPLHLFPLLGRKHAARCRAIRAGLWRAGSSIPTLSSQLT